jgi:hypothetical protein
MPSMSMNLSHPKTGNDLPLRWRTCTASSTSMSLPFPGGAPLTHTSYAWMIARSSTSARSINLVNNPTQRLSPGGSPTFPQPYDGDSTASLHVHHSSLDDAWSGWHVAARRWCRRGQHQRSRVAGSRCTGVTWWGEAAYPSGKEAHPSSRYHQGRPPPVTASAGPDGDALLPRVAW